MLRGVKLPRLAADSSGSAAVSLEQPCTCCCLQGWEPSSGVSREPQAMWDHGSGTAGHEGLCYCAAKDRYTGSSCRRVGTVTGELFV